MQFSKIFIFAVTPSQLKSYYAGMEVDDTKKISKDKKKDGDKKPKKQQDKKSEPSKPKPPKTLEGALELVSLRNFK